MGQINHHLSDQLLIGYATGNLPEAFNLVVATHVSMCDDCRARLGEYETLGGCLVEQAEIAPLAPDCLARTMARIRTMPPAPTSPAPDGGDLPGPLRDYVGGDLADVRWRALGGGVRQMRLSTASDATARLLHIPAGTRLPDHGHRGTELTLVLHGAFTDEHERFAPGDIEIADETTKHTPHAETGADCICLAATDAPLKFDGLIQRIAQPFLRI